MASLVIVSDLDGTLLDGRTYSWTPAREALQLLARQNIPLVLVSSKTRTELEPLRLQLDHHAPFIVENGGAVFVPKGLFPFPLDSTVLRGSYQVLETGAPYARLRTALKEIEQLVGCPLKGFGDMTVEELMQCTGLSRTEAILAKQREYDEPFVLDPGSGRAEDVRCLAEQRGLTVTRGGRFYHLMGSANKGRACRSVIDWYRRALPPNSPPLQTVGLGDSLNDLPMLAAVDHPILLPHPDGSHDPEIRIPVMRTREGGPVGWNAAVLEVVSTLRRTA